MRPVMVCVRCFINDRQSKIAFSCYLNRRAYYK